jgi:hypothetical protein
MAATEPGSRSTAQKWLIGCGIGCGVIIILAIAVGIGGFFFVKSIVDEFEEMDQVADVLEERYGKMREYSPEPGGEIPSYRIETFLEVREAFAQSRENIEKTLVDLASQQDKPEIEVKRPGNILYIIRTGVGLIPQIAEFFKNRNLALLEEEMGLGEYYYIYVVAYYSWLGKAPEDGPPFRISGDDERDDFWDEDEEDVREMRRERIRRRINRLILSMLRNQLDKLAERASSEVPESWRSALESEIEAMESDRYRLPWRDGLPDVLESSFRPFRDRLEASYNPMANALEVAMDRR